MPARNRNSSSPVPVKVSAPRLSEVYRRSALFRVLDAGRKKRIVWIAAPAGAGKTSVVTTYLATRRVPALWYNVDTRDGDVANLFHYLAIAARTASKQKKLRLPTFALEHQAGVAAFARGFFGELCRQRPARSVIVLDDYHDARSELFDEVVREAVCSLSNGISAIIISRAEPPPALARCVASNDFTLLGTDDLRLTPKDTAGLVRAYRPDLRGAKLESALPRIVELTNGWAAALTLLLQNQRIAGVDPLGVEEFSERLFDYFATEILDKATASQRSFFLTTSVVPSLTASIAGRLSGNADAGRTLADLEKRSFLTQRLGTSGAYRYHPLLRSFLLRRAESELGRAAVQELHCRAAEAFIEIGQIDEAMEQFEIAQEVAQRTKLILSVAPSYLAKGRGRTIEAWIGRLPVDWVEKSGWLLYWQGVSCVGCAHSRPRALLEQAYAHFLREEDVHGLYLCCASALQAVVHEGTDFSRLDPWLERFEALEKSGLPCPPPFEPMLATGMLMASAMRSMDTSSHRKWLARAKTLADRSEDIGHRILTGGFLSIYMVCFMDCFDASAIVEMLRASARAPESSALAQLTLMQGDALCLWASGDNGSCLTLVRDALALAARSGVFAWNDFLNGLGAAAALGLDDVAAAREFLASMAQAGEQRGGWHAGFYHLHAGWEALVQGNGLLALHSAEQGLQIADTAGPPFGRLIGPFAVAQSLLHLGRRDEALTWLERTGTLARATDCALVLHACELVEADCFWDEDRPRALASLRRGLELARAHGYHNMYWLSPNVMTRLAVRALEHDIEPQHVRVTIARRKLSPNPPPVHLETWPWRYRLRALGPFELCRDDEPASGSNRKDREWADFRALKGKPREFLQALVAFGGRGVRDIVLVDALWPDAEGDTGRRVFDTTLHRLRRQLGEEDAIRLSDGCVYLDERLFWLDVWALEEIMMQSEREAGHGTSLAALVTIARRLVALHRGPLLADLDVATDWVGNPRRRLSSKFERTAERLGRALEQGRAFCEAASLYECALKSRPRAEPLRAGLVRCAEAVPRPA